MPEIGGSIPPAHDKPAGKSGRVAVDKIGYRDRQPATTKKEQEMTTDDLRKASVAVFLATDEVVAKDLSEKLNWAADTIDELTRILALACR